MTISRTSVLSVFLIALLAAVAFAGVQNGISDGKTIVKTQPTPAAPAALTCTIWNSPSGTSGWTSIPVSTDVTNNMFWLQAVPSILPDFHMIFKIKFSNTSPLRKQIQSFSFQGGNNGDVITPFGVPFWGGDATTGPAIFKVKDDFGSCTYLFTVTP